MEPLGLQHLDVYHAYIVRNREHFAPWEPLQPDHFYTLDGAQRELERILRLHEGGEAARFAVFERGGTALVCIGGLWSLRRGVIHAGILGYSVDHAYQGRGYATESGRAIVDLGFNGLNLHRVEASYSPTNAASGRVLINGKWQDAILVSTINEAWRAPA